MEKALQTRLGDARDQLVAKCVDIMAVYKSDLASKKDNTQLLLPEALKLLPLYVLSLIKVSPFYLIFISIYSISIFIYLSIYIIM